MRLDIAVGSQLRGLRRWVRLRRSGGRNAVVRPVHFFLTGRRVDQDWPKFHHALPIGIGLVPNAGEKIAKSRLATCVDETLAQDIHAAHGLTTQGRGLRDGEISRLRADRGNDHASDASATCSSRVRAATLRCIRCARAADPESFTFTTTRAAKRTSPAAMRRCGRAVVTARDWKRHPQGKAHAAHGKARTRLWHHEVLTQILAKS